MSASDRQVAGSHYKDFAIQPSEYVYRNGLSWLAGNIVKYATRAGRKGGREGMKADLQKIIHYAELWLEWEGLNDAPASPDGVPRLSTDGADLCGLYGDIPGPCRDCDGE